MSFLIEMNRMGDIQEIKWSDPIYLILEKYQSIFDLIIEEDRIALTEELKNATPRISYSAKDYKFIDYDKKIFLCYIATEGKLFVFGYENIPQTTMEYKKLISRFMETLNRSSDFLGKNSVRDHFENISSLNNELVDTKRLLEKTNAKLNLINKDLNNRLVKDALTGLLSKYQYRNEIEYLIAQDPQKLGVFTFIDIDNFKNINDTYGHSLGDDYLIEFAKRLTYLHSPNTIKLRISGDEFGLFTYGLVSVGEQVLFKLWQDIQNHVLKEAIKIKGTTFPLSISAGMAVYGQDTFEIYDLIAFADFAMYNAKKNGKNNLKIFNKIDYEK